MDQQQFSPQHLCLHCFPIKKCLGFLLCSIHKGPISGPDKLCCANLSGLTQVCLSHQVRWRLGLPSLSDNHTIWPHKLPCQEKNGSSTLTFNHHPGLKVTRVTSVHSPLARITHGPNLYAMMLGNGEKMDTWCTLPPLPCTPSFQYTIKNGTRLPFLLLLYLKYSL